MASRAEGMAQLAELLPVHAIDPSMHGLVEGGPSERRRFLDWGVFHVEHRLPGGVEALSARAQPAQRRTQAGRYRRGALPWTAALAEAGDAVDDSRLHYFQRLTPQVTSFGARLLNRAADAGVPPRMGDRDRAVRMR